MSNALCGFVFPRNLDGSCCDRIRLKDNTLSRSLKLQKAFELYVTGLRIMKSVGRVGAMLPETSGPWYAER